MSVTLRLRPAQTFAVALLAVIAVVCACDAALAQASPFGMPRPAAAPPPAYVGGIIGWLLAKQAEFYRALSGLIRASKADGTAVWGLLGVSFAYGVFHAAGPGHGKAVISSYLLANEETWRRGVVLSFASAMLQALVAVALVGIAAVVFNATKKTMDQAGYVIEVASYGLIALLGARLTWMKGRAFLQAWRDERAEHAAAAHGHHDHSHHAFAHAHHGPEHSHAAPADAHHGHGHEHHTHAHVAHDHHMHDFRSHEHHAHDHESHVRPDHAHADHVHADDVHAAAHQHDEHCGHSHGPEPQELAGRGGWQRGLAAIFAVGLRPCSGAILVLVFALAQGLFWAGVASTFVMGLGTAITVATIATFAVAAKGVAARIAMNRGGAGTLAMRGLELAAAVTVLFFGAALLAGYIVTERMI